jgi:ATP/maltotriose-dependent transcriptional regulator MalT
MSLKRAERAKADFFHALSIVLPDRMMTILAVHYRFLHELPKLCMRQEHPLEYKYTIELACDFNKGRVDVEHGLHDEKFTQWLTVMEHSVAMLAARGWKEQGGGLIFWISLHTVKHHLASVHSCLGVSNRRGLREALKV